MPDNGCGGIHPRHPCKKRRVVRARGRAGHGRWCSVRRSMLVRSWPREERLPRRSPRSFARRWVPECSHASGEQGALGWLCRQACGREQYGSEDRWNARKPISRRLSGRPSLDRPRSPSETSWCQPTTCLWCRPAGRTLEPVRGLVRPPWRISICFSLRARRRRWGPDFGRTSADSPLTEQLLSSCWTTRGEDMFGNLRAAFSRCLAAGKSVSGLAADAETRNQGPKPCFVDRFGCDGRQDSVCCLRGHGPIRAPEREFACSRTVRCCRGQGRQLSARGLPLIRLCSPAA